MTYAIGTLLVLVGIVFWGIAATDKLFNGADLLGTCISIIGAVIIVYSTASEKKNREKL